MYHPESVLENEMHNILLDCEIQIDTCSWSEDQAKWK